MEIWNNNPINLSPAVACFRIWISHVKFYIIIMWIKKYKIKIQSKCMCGMLFSCVFYWITSAVWSEWCAGSVTQCLQSSWRPWRTCRVLWGRRWSCAVKCALDPSPPSPWRDPIRVRWSTITDSLSTSGTRPQSSPHRLSTWVELKLLGEVKRLCVFHSFSV